MARDVRAVAGSDPFRLALALSLLLHVAAFVFVRWEPRGFGRPAEITQLRLHLQAEQEGHEEPAALAGPAAAASAAPAASSGTEERRTVAPQIAARQPPASEAAAPPASGANASAAPAEAPLPPRAEPAVTAPQVPPDALPRQPVAQELPPATGHSGDVLAMEAGAAAPGTPVPEAGGAPAGTGGPSGPEVAGGGASSEALPGSLAAVTAPAPSTSPGGSAGGTGAAGPRGAAVPGARELAAVRRRIEAHKVYPRIAVRNGWEGRVLVEMRLAGDGGLDAVRLVEGSGHAVLDEATISAVRQASPFPPVARVLTVPVEYRLLP